MNSESVEEAQRICKRGPNVGNCWNTAVVPGWCTRALDHNALGRPSVSLAEMSAFHRTACNNASCAAINR